jgi:superfamily I DNA/RNA helicase
VCSSDLFNTLLADNPELRVGLVCFNAILADYLGSLNPHHANSDRAFVGTVYQLLRATCPSLSKDKSDLSACAGEAQAWASANPSKLFDVLIVDEGQDLRPLPAICESLGHLIRGGWSNGRWAWFEDLGQSIIKGSKDMFEPPAACQFPLRQNVRNTERIADTANAIGRNKATNSKVYGLEVDYRVHEHADSESRLRDLEQAVSDLMKSGFSSSDIVVLDYSGGNELLERSGKITNIKAAPWSLGARKDTVRYSTVRKFKGMESRAVIVYNINAPLAADDPLLYVSVTRPVFSLTLIMDPEARTAMAMVMLRSQTA